MSHTNAHFYVYQWLREDGTPYYIGKGQTNRAYESRRLYKPSNDRIEIVKENLTEQEAFDLEIELIAKYGRKDLGTGILRNKTDGGDGATPSLETRQKISDANKGKNAGKTPWNKGKTGVQQSTRKGGHREDLTQEAKESIASKVRAARTGKKMSEETKKKIRESMLRRKELVNA